MTQFGLNKCKWVETGEAMAKRERREEQRGQTKRED